MPSGSYCRARRTMGSSLSANHSGGLFQTNRGVTFRTARLLAITSGYAVPGIRKQCGYVTEVTQP